MEEVTKEYRHIPVLLSECLEQSNLKTHHTFVDTTLGGAGHSSEVAQRLGSDGVLIGIDQDEMALAAAGARLRNLALNTPPQIELLRGNFGNLDASELTRIIRDYSDEKWASRIAQFIVESREHAPIETSSQLVEIIKAAIPASARRAGGHPAKRTFQALRIEVNSELSVLRKGLEAAVRWLNPGGRILVISYHSLEDRVVKEVFAKHARTCTCPPGLPVCACGANPVLRVRTRKPILPSAEEIENNPRARSAKLRVAEKIR